MCLWVLHVVYHAIFILISYYIISYHVKSYHITSYHIFCACEFHGSSSASSSSGPQVSRIVNAKYSANIWNLICSIPLSIEYKRKPQSLTRGHHQQLYKYRIICCKKKTCHLKLLRLFTLFTLLTLLALLTMLSLMSLPTLLPPFSLFSLLSLLKHCVHNAMVYCAYMYIATCSERSVDLIYGFMDFGSKCWNWWMEWMEFSEKGLIGFWKFLDVLCFKIGFQIKKWATRQDFGSFQDQQLNAKFFLLVFLTRCQKYCNQQKSQQYQVSQH